MVIARIWPANQWPRERFFAQVDRDEEAEVRVAAAYGQPICRSVIRHAAIEAILSYAIPAGNA